MKHLTLPNYYRAPNAKDYSIASSFNDSPSLAHFGSLGKRM